MAQCLVSYAPDNFTFTISDSGWKDKTYWTEWLQALPEFDLFLVPLRVNVFIYFWKYEKETIKLILILCGDEFLMAFEMVRRKIVGVPELLQNA
jgi:hypothetical protein